jgi:hypothetical protein
MPGNTESGQQPQCGWIRLWQSGIWICSRIVVNFSYASGFFLTFIV